MLISWLVLILQEFRYNFSAALLGVVLLGGAVLLGGCFVFPGVSPVPILPKKP